MHRQPEPPKKEIEFSKRLLMQESILVWITTIAFIVLAFVCIANQFFGELPWLVAMATCPWTAYAVGQGFYYRKAEKENTKGGIKYDTAMLKYKTQDEEPVIAEEDFTENAEG